MEVQQIVEEVNSHEVTVGELLTVVAMYPPHHSDPYLNSIREALRLISREEQHETQE